MVVFIFFFFLAASYFILNLLFLKKQDWLLAYFLVFTSLVVVGGNLLSILNLLNNLVAWFFFGMISVLFLVAISLATKTKIPLPNKSNLYNIQSYFLGLKVWFHQEVDNYTKRLLIPMAGTILCIGVITLLVVLFSATHSLDSMSYHLPRMAFYMQNGNANSFGADYWAQEVHPKNATFLFLFTYLISGRNENLTQLVQWLAYWISILSVYGITRKMGNNRSASLLAGLGSGLIIIWVLEATTTQNDLLITAFIGISVNFLLAFPEKQEWKYLFLSAIGLSLAIGTKASSLLVLFPVGLISLYVFTKNERTKNNKLRNLMTFVGICILSVMLFALPSGYLENIQLHGHPIGPENVRTIHSFENQLPGYNLENGSLNLLRYGLEFVSLDGLQGDLVNKAQSIFRVIPAELLRWVGVDISNIENERGNFYVNRTPRSHEDLSYWGILGFGLVWFVIWITAFGKKKPGINRIFAWAFLLFFVSQAFAGPYDPWRGRYFSTAVIFALPLLSIVLQSTNNWIRAYSHVVILLACISAISATIFRNKGEIFINAYSFNSVPLFSMNRIQQLTRNDDTYLTPFNAFNENVPNDATIATFLKEGTLEFSLFGEKLTRRILPLNSFTNVISPIPAEAEYLLYTEGLFPCASPDDIYLGRDWYLRKLTATNRNCPSLDH